MGIASFIFGLIALVGSLVGLIPLLGWLNWGTLAIAGVGLILAIVALIVSPQKAFAIAGLVLCLMTFCVGIPRLIIGFGVI